MQNVTLDDGVFEFGRCIVMLPITGLSTYTPKVTEMVQLTISGGKVTGASTPYGTANSSLPKPENHWGVVMREPKYEGQEVPVCIRGRVKVTATRAVTAGFPVRVNYAINSQNGVEEFGVNPLADAGFFWKNCGYALEDIAEDGTGFVLFDGVTGAFAELAV